MRPGGGIIAVTGDLLSTPGRFDQDSPIAVVDPQSDPDSPDRHPGRGGAAITITAATLAARRSERQIIDRLNGVIDTLGHANFPYTRERPRPGCGASPGPISSPMRTTAG